MKRRTVMAAIAAAPFLPAVARAQTAGRMYRIGWVTGTPLSDPTSVTVLDELKNNGFVQGNNLTVDPRGFSLRPDQMMAVARQIADDKVDVLMTAGGAAAKAAQAASSTIPILVIADDMVGDGLVDSLANRRGNTTGISILSAELDGKRQELLIDLLPTMKKMAMLTDGGSTQIPLLQARAKQSGVDMSVLTISKPDDIEPALKRAKADGVTAINMLGSALLFGMRQQIFAATSASEFAVMYQWAEGTREGALAGYGPSLIEIFRQRGRQAAKLLRGAKPSDMPIEQPTVLKLAVNLKLAAQLGITVPPAFLQRADEVIE
jgi:putative ABC transport system substrate-binding protein